jgi:cytochrome bd-type quinol oxidase subunit 2
VIEKDTILAVLGNDIAVAGLVLIFAGFLFTKSGEYQTRRGDKYRWLAAAGMIPVMVALLSGWLCIDAIEGNLWDANHALPFLKIVLALTGLYAIIAAVIAFFP